MGMDGFKTEKEKLDQALIRMCILYNGLELDVVVSMCTCYDTSESYALKRLLTSKLKLIYRSIVARGSLYNLCAAKCSSWNACLF
jgi:hypothetical protein